MLRDVNTWQVVFEIGVDPTIGVLHCRCCRQRCNTTSSIMAADAHSPGSPSQALADLHISLEVDPSPASSPPPMLNGFKTAVNGLHHITGSQDGLDPMSKLQQELERTREEKDELATQYRNLLGKLQTMRNTLGNKLKQDAVCTTPIPHPLESCTHARTILGRARQTRTINSPTDCAE